MGPPALPCGSWNPGFLQNEPGAVGHIVLRRRPLQGPGSLASGLRQPRGPRALELQAAWPRAREGPRAGPRLEGPALREGLAGNWASGGNAHGSALPDGTGRGGRTAGRGPAPSFVLPLPLLPEAISSLQGIESPGGRERRLLTVPWYLSPLLPLSVGLRRRHVGLCTARPSGRRLPTRPPGAGGGSLQLPESPEGKAVAPLLPPRGAGMGRWRLQAKQPLAP